MTDPSLDQIQGLIQKLVLPFYDIDRDIELPLKKRRAETDAEHSWSTALLACALAPQVDSKLDVGKIAQYALVHDLVEVFAGDTSPWIDTPNQPTKQEREAVALTRIKQEYTAFPWIGETIEAVENLSSDEAKFAYAVDKLIILLMRRADKGRHYVERGISKKHFDEKLKGHRKKAHTHGKIGAYYDQLLEVFEAHPEYFYQP